MTHASGFINPPLRGLVGRLLDVLLPPVCVACGSIVSSAHALCAPCWGRVDFIDDPKCRCCGRPFEFDPGYEAPDADHPTTAGFCGACLKSPPVFTRARSAVVYDEHSRRFILSYKHGDRLDMVPALVPWLERAGHRLIEDADLMAPVPLHWSRFLSRKFNQSAELARNLGKQTAVPYVPDLLVRKKRTPSQTGLNARQRARNVRGAFMVKPENVAILTGKRVLLIDDVMTTGATLNACAGILLWAGASAVDVLTIARVVRPQRD